MIALLSSFSLSVYHCCLGIVKDAFTKFEHEGWERVANKYDSTWSSSTRQFIPPLLDAADVSGKMAILDVGCGPGYVSAAASERGAVPIGLDFSAKMIAIAKKMFPRIEFRQGDAQDLPFADSNFDRVVANFALLHLAKPERAMAEAARVLKTGGRFAFTTWAKMAENPFVKLVDEAIQAHANADADLPPGPPFYLFETADEFRKALERAGFDGPSMSFKVHQIEWKVPTAGFVFDAELNAGVRTAGLLAWQTPQALRNIQSAIEKAVQQYAKGNGFAIPKSAYVVTISKN
jgi:ubiquinone/menaquinone biosynthesis C-methylase UbiE